ncbi:SURF1 family cytochrome oxidase biogenesis protein [Leucobacter viscericola]|nr:SURF1 family cytochrome oxidase biogenesis protein [Leucobacter viscericola]
MSQPSRKAEYLGDPTLARVMRRPQWILALLLALLVAAVFAWLGQWQMSNAIRSDEEQNYNTETLRPLSEATELGKGVNEYGAGVVVSVRGSFVPGDSQVLTPRENQGKSGAWVIGHLVTEGPEAEANGNLAVAIGWAPDQAAAEKAIKRLDADPAFAQSRAFEGRYMPPEGAQIPEPTDDPQRLQTMLPAHLANLWADVQTPVYAGYLVMHEGTSVEPLMSGLDKIDSVAPLPPEKVSWLNVFYAIEWVVFAGFAVFFWFRLARDAWEKEHELKLLKQEAEGGVGSDPGADRKPDPDSAAAATRPSDPQL